MGTDKDDTSTIDRAYYGRTANEAANAALAEAERAVIERVVAGLAHQGFEIKKRAPKPPRPPKKPRPPRPPRYPAADVVFATLRWLESTEGRIYSNEEIVIAVERILTDAK